MNNNHKINVFNGKIVFKKTIFVYSVTCFSKFGNYSQTHSNLGNFDTHWDPYKTHYNVVQQIYKRFAILIAVNLFYFFMHILVIWRKIAFSQKRLLVDSKLKWIHIVRNIGWIHNFLIWHEWRNSRKVVRHE